MFSPVATGLFCLRNGDKTASGDFGRLPVTVGQGAAVLKAGAEYNNPVSKGIKTFLDTSETIAKSDKFYRGLSKTVKFAADHVNPLIVASSGLKVALADKDERKDTIIKETGCLSAMFLGEGLMKKHMDKILVKLPVGKKWLPIIKGVAFVAGSIGSSTLGYKAGEIAAKYWDKPLVKTEIQRATDQLNDLPKGVNYKA